MTPTNWAEVAGGVVILALILRNLKGMHELTGASPKTGEALAEVTWRRLKGDGELVHPGDVIAATFANGKEMEIQAHHQGTLRWVVPDGVPAESGKLIATIDNGSEAVQVIVSKEYFQS